MLLNKAVLGLAKLAPEEESRYTLQAIEVGHDSATVTNGHYLVNVASCELAHSEDSFPAMAGLDHEKLASAGNLATPILIAKTAALSALKAIKSMGKRISIPILAHAAITTETTQPNSATKLAVNTLESIHTFDARTTGSFPNWHSIIPRGKPLAQIALSAAYLEKLCAYVREYGDERSQPIRLTIYDADSALRFDARTADGQNVMGLLMPLRSDSVSFPVVYEEENKPAELEPAA